MLDANKVGDGRITPAGLRWLIERCLEAGRVDTLDLAGRKDDRRPVSGGGLAVIAGGLPIYWWTRSPTRPQTSTSSREAFYFLSSAAACSASCSRVTMIG